MAFSLQPMDESSARQILAWRYDAPYDLYNPGAGDVEQTMQVFVDPQYAYYMARDSRGVAAYCCFGADAQVPGGDYEQPALDVGLGVRPDLTGRGLGSMFVQAVLDFARTTGYRPCPRPAFVSYPCCRGHVGKS